MNVGMPDDVVKMQKRLIVVLIGISSVLALGVAGFSLYTGDVTSAAVLVILVVTGCAGTYLKMKPSTGRFNR